MRCDATLLLALLLLAGCNKRSASNEAESGDALHVATNEANGMSVSVPGLDAKLSLPGLDLSRHVDLDGIKLAPGTRIRTLDVGRSGQGGQVSLTFANPMSPADLLAYYRNATTKAGFVAGQATSDSLAAQKNGGQFTLDAHPDGTGSAGTITIRRG